MNPLVVVAATVTQMMEALKPTPPTKGPLPSRLNIRWPESQLSREMEKARATWRF